MYATTSSFCVRVCVCVHLFGLLIIHTQRGAAFHAISLAARAPAPPGPRSARLLWPSGLLLTDSAPLRESPAPWNKRNKKNRVLDVLPFGSTLIISLFHSTLGATQVRVRERVRKRERQGTLSINGRNPPGRGRGWMARVGMGCVNANSDRDLDYTHHIRARRSRCMLQW